jgi:hypothetical protein
MGRVVERFLAVSDGGKRVTIIIEQDVIDAGTHDDPGATIDGRKRAYTDSGESVDRIDDQTWLVPSVGIVRRR